MLMYLDIILLINLKCITFSYNKISKKIMIFYQVLFKGILTLNKL